jgi:hypothetical protein
MAAGDTEGPVKNERIPLRMGAKKDSLAVLVRFEGLNQKSFSVGGKETAMIYVL